MIRYLEDLAARRRFGMKPGLDTIRRLCASLGNPERKFKAIHIAGTNGKGAVAAMLDAALGTTFRVGRYTSPHLVRINERFFLNGAPVDDETLDRLAAQIPPTDDTTFFEALTAVAFLLYAEAKVDYAILETGLGGRLDATNVCSSALTIITKIGLDHCDWLGDTVEKIAAEKAGILKPGVPIVLAANEHGVRAVIETRAREVGAPFYYAPDLVTLDEVPNDLSLKGSFNRENAQTALAALKVLSQSTVLSLSSATNALARAVWPGRFQQIDAYIIDGAHNPPAARALAHTLSLTEGATLSDLIFGACGDKDVAEVLSILKPHVAKGYAVKTNNPRSLDPETLAAKMNAAGIPSVPCESLSAALQAAPHALICGSLFLAGEALVELKAYPWPTDRFDPSESLRCT